MENKKLYLDPLTLFSHELKNPLSALKIGLEIVMQNPESKENKKILRLMDEELNSLIDFINCQLDLKLIKEKKDLLEFQWYSWKYTLLKALSSCRLPADKKNIVFKINNQSIPQFTEAHLERCQTFFKRQKDFEVFMDAKWISQVLSNFFSNSLKFSPEGGTVFIDYELCPEKGLKCFITDEGKGFFEKNSSRLFEAFYTEKGTGAGLGLALVKALVESHGGSVEAFASKETDKGAVFSFWIPKARKMQKKAS